MNDHPVFTNVTQGINSRLHRLHFIRKFYLTIGHAATRGQLVINRTIRANSDDFSSKRFVKSLQELARMPKVFESQDLEDVLVRSNQVLASATTIFPLTIFPDTIILDRTKLTVIRRNFFLSEDVMSIRIEDVLNVSVSLGPFFGSITIATRVLSTDDHFSVKNLLKDDVMNLKHMIQGYVIARHNNIACDHLNYEELVHTLRELGHETNTRHKASYYTAR